MIMGLILHYLQPMLKSQSQMVKGQGQHMVNLNPSPSYVEHDPNSGLGPKSTFLIQFGFTLIQFLFVVGFILISYVVS